MSKFIICAFLAAIGYQCYLADESPREAIKKFHNEVRVEVCNPDTLDNSIIGKLSDCMQTFFQIEQMADHVDMYIELVKDCITTDDLKPYTKVNVTTNLNKLVLSSWCSRGFVKCIHQKFQKAKQDQTEDQVDPDFYKKVNGEQVAEFKTCLKNATKV
ncbi:unnamed protein product [Oppiella nova]|uniref:Uncharacterized protein n=1 Tax=Oppiella nova TaxID=334625 RepID=A0A7R9MGG4_9ACAR|nr:unnamed protein product [Oppiella nova]CAG2176942.1 unnamed protein product [Oppiella nova]